MTYFVVENFGHGLDARKHILNLPPGALFQAKNCNLNRGGEPESCKAFVSKGSAPPGTFGLLAAGGKLFTFGSAAYTTADMPAGLNYQKLVHPSGTAMNAYIYGTVVKGKPFVIAQFDGGYGVYFNALFITDWQPTSGALLGTLQRDGTITPYSALADIATNFAGQINTDAVYTAVAAGNTVTITGRPGTPFSASALALNASGGVNDQTATIATTQTADAGGPAAGAQTVLTFSGVQPEWNDSVNSGAGGYVPTTAILSIKINGVELLTLGGLVASDDTGAADATAGTINAHVTVPNYTATSSGPNVTIKADTTGVGSNGYAVVVDNGTPWHANNPAPLSGGSGGTGAKTQISTVTFGGTYEAADSWSITLAGHVFTIASYVPPGGGTPGDGSGSDGSGGTGGSGVVGSANGQRPTAAITKNSKTYAIAGPTLFGSMLGDCTKWNAGTGSFAIDMSSELAGAENLTALALYQNNLAIFSRSTVQIRFCDPDPGNDETLQALQNIGTLAAKSVVSFGDTDVFFLSDTGLRSLKTRYGTNSATLSDIGSPIDPLVVAAIRAAGADAGKACATMEPTDGRFLLQIGLTTYVFNYFPDAKVGGWTTWESGLAISDFASVEQKLFARAGDTFYLLGGDNNDIYSPNPMNVRIPFLSARQLATLKHFTALDVACDGVFDVTISTDPTRPDFEETVATVNGSTYGFGINPFQANDVTAIALRFTGRPSKYNRLSSLAIHFQPLRENA